VRVETKEPVSKIRIDYENNTLLRECQLTLLLLFFQVHVIQEVQQSRTNCAKLCVSRNIVKLGYDFS